jgi:hypothetical protein
LYLLYSLNELTAEIKNTTREGIAPKNKTAFACFLSAFPVDPEGTPAAAVVGDVHGADVRIPGVTDDDLEVPVLVRGASRRIAAGPAVTPSPIPGVRRGPLVPVRRGRGERGILQRAPGQGGVGDEVSVRPDVVDEEGDLGQVVRNHLDDAGCCVAVFAVRIPVVHAAVIGDDGEDDGKVAVAHGDVCPLLGLPSAVVKARHPSREHEAGGVPEVVVLGVRKPRTASEVSVSMTSAPPVADDRIPPVAEGFAPTPRETLTVGIGIALAPVNIAW